MKPQLLIVTLYSQIINAIWTWNFMSFLWLLWQLIASYDSLWLLWPVDTLDSLSLWHKHTHTHTLTLNHSVSVYICVPVCLPISPLPSLHRSFSRVSHFIHAWDCMCGDRLLFLLTFSQFYLYTRFELSRTRKYIINIINDWYVKRPYTVETRRQGRATKNVKRVRNWHNDVRYADCEKMLAMISRLYFTIKFSFIKASINSKR